MEAHDTWQKIPILVLGFVLILIIGAIDYSTGAAHERGLLKKSDDLMDAAKLRG